MTDTKTNPAPDRPLVTFALFAYNQEKYIREAVEGAFSQTYEPLEIILSDDCSSDRTYEIMQEMAAAYEGPHEVRVRRSEANRGLAKHINEVASVANGKIVVVAAGDDISAPERTELIARAFRRDEKTTAVFSDFTTIPPDQKFNRYGNLGSTITLSEIIIAGGGVQKGATYGYSRDCFSRFVELPNWISSEDRILPFRAALIGRVKHLEISLVKYRLPENSEVEKKKSRILGYNHPNHFNFLMENLVEARSSGDVGQPTYIFSKYLLHWVQLALKLKAMGNIQRLFGNLAWIPVRIFRKVATVYVRLKEGGAR